ALEKTKRSEALAREVDAARELLRARNQEIEKEREQDRQRREQDRQRRAQLQATVDERSRRVVELENWGKDLWDTSNRKYSTIEFQGKSIEKLPGRERELSSKLIEAESRARQTTADYIYVKSTLSYSLGRILTLPFALVYDLFVWVFSALHRILGPHLWPPGTKRGEVVDALLHLRETVATGTYLLRVHGVGAFFAKI